MWIEVPLRHVHAEEKNLVLRSQIAQLGESKGGELETAERLTQHLSDGDPKTSMGWEDGIDDFPAILEIKLSSSAPISVVVCYWKWMPSDYVLEGWTGNNRQDLSSVSENIVIGPKIKLHMFSPVRVDRLRLRVTGTVHNDIHGRRQKGKRLCALAEVGIYAEGEMPDYIERFLSSETPRLVATKKSLIETRRRKDYKPDSSWLNAQVPVVGRPVTHHEYLHTPKGKAIHERNSQRTKMLLNCAWSYAKTGDERYARKTRQVMLAIMDQYEKYQDDRFSGIKWKAVTFQGPAYRMHRMNTAYDLIASSPCMKKEDKMRFIYFSLDNTEFQYRAIRDLFKGRENWSANSLGEIVLTAYYFKGFPETARWVDAADGKVGGCFAPFMADGFWWECSPSHSVYTLRGLCKYGLGKHLLGDPIWTKEHGGKSIAFLLEALGKTINPLGEIPSINDSYDNDRPLLSHRKEFRPALHLIGRGDLLEMFKDSGEPPVVPGHKLQPIQKVPPTYTSVLLPKAGIAIMRDGWRREDSYLLLDYGPHGGGHGQRDKLSIIMFANGHHWIPDAACAPHYCLFPEQKTWHTQTISHNTVMVDNKSQRKCRGELLLWKTDDEMDIASAQHKKGYPGLIHRRTVVHPKGEYFLIHDTLCPETTKRFDLDWLLHIYGEFKSQSKGRLLFEKDKKRLLVLSQDIGAELLKIEQGLCGGLERDNWKGKGYPSKGDPGWIYIPYIRLRKSINQEHKKTEYFVLLYPFTGKEPQIETEEICDAEERASGIKTTIGRTEDWYIEAAPGYDSKTQGSYQCGGISGNSRVLFLRRRDGKTVLRKEYQ